MTRGGSQGWPFVGRQRQLTAVVDQLGDPACRGVLLVGGSGVGKTRMAQEVLASAEQAGGVAEWLVATAAAAEIPFGALARWLPGHDTSVDLTSSGVAVFHAASRRLTEQAGGRPLTVGIDDIHHLDPSSTVLLHHLVHTRVAKLVLTLRSRRELPEPIASLWKDGLIQRVDVGPMTRPEVEELLARVLDGPLDQALAGEFWRTSAGNLLYLRELVAAAQASGVMVRSHGSWHLRGELPPSPPLVDLVESRIAGVSDDARGILDLVALGEPVSVDILEATAAADDIAELEESELLVIEADGRRRAARLTHPLYADVLRTRCGPRRSRALARQLANAYREVGLRRDGDLLRYVVLELDGGGTCEFSHLRRATFLALKASDPILAERLGWAAHQAQPSNLACVFALVEALTRQGRYDECVELLDRIPTEDEVDLTKLRRAKVGFLYWAYGDIDRAEAEMARLEAEVVEEESKLLLLSTRSLMACQAGEVSLAASLAAAALEGTESPRLAWEAKQRLSLAVAMMGRSDEAIRLATECLGDAGRPEVVVPPDLDLAGAAIALATYHAGRIDEMEAVGDLTYADGLSLDDPVLRMLGSAVRGIAAVARGAPGVAGPLLDESISLLRPTDIDGLRALILGMRAYVAALSGDICLAERSLERARAEGHPALRWYEPHLDLGRASVLAASGMTAEAIAALEQAGAEARRRGQGALEFDVLFYAVRLGAGSPVVDRLIEVADAGDGDLPAMAARYARGRATADGYELDAAADGLEAIGMCLIAAEAAGDAAAAHGAAGDRLSEARSLHHCRALEARCTGLAPWVLRDRLARDSLTAREREAARLVATGLSNKEAAGHMQVSTRTVESHLDRVYAKLGINHRSQLAGVFGIGEPATP